MMHEELPIQHQRQGFYPVFYGQRPQPKTIREMVCDAIKTRRYPHAAHDIIVERQSKQKEIEDEIQLQHEGIEDSVGQG